MRYVVRTCFTHPTEEKLCGFVQVGAPQYTAFDINDRGNRVYIKYEPNQPTIFPVNETRFYKPKMHLQQSEGKKGGSRDI